MAQAPHLPQEKSAEPLFFEKDRKHRLLQHMLWIACVVFWYFSLYSFYVQNKVIGWLTLGYACLSSIWIVFTFRFSSRRFIRWSSRLLIVLLAGILLYYIVLGGVGNSFSLWSYLYPLVTFFMLGKREGLVVVAFFWVLECLLLLTPAQALLQTNYVEGFKFRYLLSQALVIVMTYIFEAGRQRNQEKMHHQQCRLKMSESRAQEAIKQFKITQSQLVQSGKLASIGELAAGVAHELNQPLMVIRGNAQLLKRQMKKPDFQQDSMGGFLTTIERNTKRMGYIIDHLRSFSRQSPSLQEPVEINKVVKNAFLLMREQLRLRSIEVDQDLQEDLPLIMGEANQLEQVILNLLTNSRDALESDATHVYVKRRRRIVIATRHDTRNKTVEITCRDTGVGIPTKSLDSIFDPFFTTKAVGKGTGLGLSISYGILQNHNGQIEVMDTGPEGTVFRVVLPASAPKSKPISQEAIPAQHN